MTKPEFLESLKAILPSHLRIDADPSEAALLDAIASAALSWVEGGIGKNVPWNDGRVLILALTAAADMYDQRAYVVRGNTNLAVRENTRRLLDDFTQQLRLEGRA